MPEVALREKVKEEGLARMFPSLGLTNPAAIGEETTPSFGLPRFSVKASYVNTERPSRRGPELTWKYARCDKSLAARRRAEGLHISTLYKRKADKVRPVDSSDTGGQVPGGRDDWKARAWARLEGIAKDNTDTQSECHGILIPRTTRTPVGTRLTEERASRLIIGDGVLPDEKRLLLQCLMNREAALAWTFAEMGRISEEVAPPQEIRTVPHKAWQAASFPIPRAIRDRIGTKLQERLDAGVYERCEGPYRNPWFAVKKKNGDFRLVNAAMNINAVTIRDATLPPSADEFSEHVAGMVVSSLIDWFSGYDQIPLHTNSRDLTGFNTVTHGLLRQTTLPQGATNSVAQFVRIGLRILEGLKATPYLDDITVDGPKTDYGQRMSEQLPGVRAFMLEHIMNLDKTLLAVECAGATVAGEKSQWCMPGLKVVGYVCDAAGRHPESAKVEKIINWPTPQTVTEVKGFLGICVYYRIWVEGFAVTAAPLYRLTKKNARWDWTEEHDAAVNALKLRLTAAPALASICYNDGSGRIIVVVDASPSGWGAVLMQEHQVANGKWKRRPVRYESGIWSETESRYDQLKRECRGLLKALKKFRFWLYGVHFYVETDANTLCAQLSRSVTDLPGALVTQWIAWIRLFDFEIKHISGNLNQAADALSRRRATPEDLDERKNEEDIDEWVDAQLSATRATRLSSTRDATITREENRTTDGGGSRILNEEYSDKYEEIAVFLKEGMKRNGRSKAEWKAFRAHALKFTVREDLLFRVEKGRRDQPPKRVIDEVARKTQLIRSVHDESGHRGREGTFQRLKDRYFWEGMYSDVRKHCDTCEECQKRQGLRQGEELTPTWTNHRWQKVGVDIVRMPKDQGRKYLVLARSDLSGWVEGRALTAASSKLVARFLYEDVICRHGIFQKLVVDGGPENKDLVEALASKYGIRRVVVSAYHPEANGMVERGHAPIVNALSKLSGGERNWVANLPTVLWADRTTVRRSTGLTPYEVEYADKPVLPIELEIPTWTIVNWNDVRTQSDLIAARARILERREEDIAEVAAHLRRIREGNKEDFDTRHRIRSERMEVGQLVLLRNVKTDIDMSAKHKLAMRWLGPYRILDAVEDKGTYLLAEIGQDGAQLQGTFAGNRLRPFRSRQADVNEAVNIEGGEGSVLVEDFATEDGDNTTETRQMTEEDEAASGAQNSYVKQRVLINVPSLPSDEGEYTVLQPRGRGRQRRWLDVRGETEE